MARPTTAVTSHQRMNRSIYNYVYRHATTGRFVSRHHPEAELAFFHRRACRGGSRKLRFS